MFSHGFIALAFFMGFLGVMAWLGRGASGPALGAHVTCVIAVTLTIVYGMDGTQMAVLLVAGAVAVREVRCRPWPHLLPRA